MAYAVLHEIHHMDVKTAFLNAVINVEVYVEQPSGFKNPEFPKCVWLLRCLYGLKQSPCMWNKTLHDFLVSKGFNPLEDDSCVYIRWQNSKLSIILLYVDDMLIITVLSELDSVKNLFKARLFIYDRL